MKYKINDSLKGKFGKIKEQGKMTPYTIKKGSHWRIKNIINNTYILENLEDYKVLYKCSESFVKLHFSKVRGR